MKKLPPLDCLRQVYRVFSLLMTDVEGLSRLGAAIPGQGVMWYREASHEEPAGKQHSSVASASVPSPRFLPRVLALACPDDGL